MSKSILECLKKKHEQLRANRDDMEKYLQANPVTDYMEICNLNTQEIHDRIQNRSLTASLVLKSFQNRCKDLEDQNFLSEYILEANSWAEQLDNNTGKLLDNPMSGVPVSIKECVRVAGKDATYGLVKHCCDPVEIDSVIFKVLKHVNAIPFITTSMAQSGLSVNSSNPIFGTQENPRHPEHVAGGSSGGEGLIISLQGSPVGFGTDIGGSVRFPSAFNEICGLKTTSYRISTKDMPSRRIPDTLNLKSVLGPMGRNVSDLKNLMVAVLCPYHFELDPTVVPLPFNLDMYEGHRKPILKIGYYDCFDDDRLVKVTPSVKRGIQTAVNALKKRGHELVPFTVPEPYEIFLMALKELFHDAGEAFIKQMRGEPLDNSVKKTLKLAKLPRIVKRSASFVPRLQYGHHLTPGLEASRGLSSSSEAAILLKKIQDYRDKFFTAMGDLDAIVCPLYPVPVPRIDTLDLYNNVATCHSIIYNILDVPAGVVCVDRSTEEDNEMAQKLTEKFKLEKNHADALFHANQTKKGMPLCAQVVARPYKEELVLRIMKLLEEECDFKASMPL